MEVCIHILSNEEAEEMFGFHPTSGENRDKKNAL